MQGWRRRFLTGVPPRVNTGAERGRLRIANGVDQGIGGDVAIWAMATTSIRAPRMTSPSRIRKKRKCPLIPMRKRIVAR